MLIAESVDEATGGEAGAVDAVGEPRVIDFCEEASDLAPAGAFAGLAGIAYEHDEEVEAVAGSVDHAVGPPADQVAKGGEQLEENGGWVGLGVGSDGTDREPSDSMQGGFAQQGIGRQSRWVWPG